MNTSRKTLVAGLLAVMAVAPAFADKGGHGKGGGHDDDRDRVVRVERDDPHRAGDHHRHDERVVQVEPSHGHGCPPGLAKKHNGCMPPGQAKKYDHDRVVVGERLPPGAVYTVPRRVLSTLPPPPHGYRYAVVNNRVVLVSRSDIVVDILLSLAG